MKRIDVIRILASAALSLGMLAGFLAVAGCSDSGSGDKRDDPTLKASMQKSLEIYKSKSPAKKGNSAAEKSRP
jgi:hypothetical protein